ncbi:MAG: FumA C-terminus/TtdB family hydratase beta subunit [Candidatus Izimaplasma sp.]|nr:FumA C-terminus/TtdB family hydratase beta subunit [Candidatus Izimaplasma bacterium]
MEKKLTTPINDSTRETLIAGQEVLISGYIYTARDAAHKLLVDAINKKEKTPFDIKDQIVYYVGPTPARPNQVIGACGPTSSYRMDKFSPTLMENGLKIMIGKGPRSDAFTKSLVENEAVYLIAIGGLGAKLSKTVIENTKIAYNHLESEAIHRLKVINFPAIVAIDSKGNSIFK